MLDGDESLEKEIQDKISAKIKDLPTLPTIATKILEVTENPESTVDDLKQVIVMDQVVSARLLKAVNSAFFGFPRKIDTISQAIVILGFNNVRSLALSVSILGAFSSKHIAGGMDLNNLWKHAVGTAFIAQALSRMLGMRKSEHFFVAGLLHDIGFIPMQQTAPRDLGMVVQHSQKNIMPIYKAEMDLLGFTHADVGCFIAEKWLLPGTLKEPIACHHPPFRDLEFPETTLAVHAADVLCKVRGFGGYGDNESTTPDSIDEKARRMFNILDNMPAEAESYLEDSLERAKDFLSIFS